MITFIAERIIEPRLGKYDARAHEVNRIPTRRSPEGEARACAGPFGLLAALAVLVL